MFAVFLSSSQPMYVLAFWYGVSSPRPLRKHQVPVSHLQNLQWDWTPKSSGVGQSAVVGKKKTVLHGHWASTGVL